jgi:hypothetical protein
MSRSSLLWRNLPVSAGAILAAAATSSLGDFRARDVRFFLELFSNWIETNYSEGTLLVQNTQISRFLAELTLEGTLKKKTTKKLKLYYLTRSGIVELSSMLIHDTEAGRRERFFFVVYFLSSYKKIIISMIEKDKKRYPYILSLELERLLDAQSVINKEVERVRFEMKQLRLRISLALESADMFEQEIAGGADLRSTLKKFQARFPYGMNNVKPLTDLVNTLPPALQKWEPAQGNRKRVKGIWGPHLHLLGEYLERLKDLKELLE